MQKASHKNNNTNRFEILLEHEEEKIEKKEKQRKQAEKQKKQKVKYIQNRVITYLKDILDPSTPIANDKVPAIVFNGPLFCSDEQEKVSEVRSEPQI
ncbi:hypothetical protein FACS189472_16330 [Alphaproteobacteria bacterium]|nr:hypothetical protein FACS189472_16330 [Alphaproteobacteria bacterium]